MKPLEESVSFRLTEGQIALLEDCIDSFQDSGPVDEGWQSDEFQEVRFKIQSALTKARMRLIKNQ